MSATYSLNVCSSSVATTIPWTLKLRLDCDGCLAVYDAHNHKTYIYMTNLHTFKTERDQFLAQKENTYLTPEGRQESKFLGGRGIQFDVQINDGYVFRSYTYVPGSIRGGGFDEYPLK